MARVGQAEACRTIRVSSRDLRFDRLKPVLLVGGVEVREVEEGRDVAGGANRF